jgi:TRAP-type C4-dicarboxylate transport system permease small subunit
MASVSIVLWDDFTMDFFWAIFGTAVQLILSFIAPLFLLTGELCLGILSLGYYRPQLKKEAIESELPYREVSFWVGLIIWIGIILYFTYPQE